MKRRTLFQIACVTASLAALVWLLDRIGWDTVGGALSRIGPSSLAVLLLLGWTESLADGAALWVVMGRSLRLGFGIAVNAAGAMLNLVLPWESGEVLKGALLNEQFGARSSVSGTIIWNYIFKISRPAVSLAAALCGWALTPGADRFVVAVVLAANLLAFLPYLALRALIRFGAAAGLLRVLRFVPVLNRHPGHWVEVARSIDHEVRQFWHERPADYLKAFGLQVAARATGWAGMLVALRALGAEVSFGQASLVYAAVNVADYVVAILPARVGVSEGASYFIFRFLGMEPAIGVIMYAVLRVRTIATNGVLTPFAFVSWKPVAPVEPPAGGAGKAPRKG